MGTPNVERSELRAGRLTLRAEDAPKVFLIGLAEELDDHLHALDVARPAEARLALPEAGLLQVVLKRPVGLRSLVAERQPDHEIYVGRADMGTGALRELADEVPRCEPAREVDALAPRAEIAKQRH